MITRKYLGRIIIKIIFVIIQYFITFDSAVAIQTVLVVWTTVYIGKSYQGKI